jgi:hypothetical protein
MENLNENVPQVNESSVNDQPVHEPQVNENKGSFDEVKNFYKGDFKNIFTTVFTNPIDGIYNIFKNPSPKAYTQSLILFGSVFLTYVLGFYVLDSSLELKEIIKASLFPIIIMLMITVISFGIKSISGKADFKAELLTGGLAGIPIGLYIVFIILLKIFGNDVNAKIISNPLAAISMISDYVKIIILVMLYIFIMLNNILKQSLKASGTKDAVSFFISPASILLAFYLAFKVMDFING